MALILTGGFLYWYSARARRESLARITDFASCAAAGFPIMESYPERCATPDGRSFTREITPQSVTVTGQLTCLPHNDTSGPQTLECAFGIRSGETYYGINDPEMKYVTSLATGTTVTVTGTLTAAPDSTYDIQGIIEIQALTTE